MDTSLLDLLTFMLEGKSMLDYTNLFSTSDYEKNDEITKKIFL